MALALGSWQLISSGASASEPGSGPVGKGLSSSCREPRMDPAL
jgi:hypothetical protein